MKKWCIAHNRATDINISYKTLSIWTVGVGAIQAIITSQTEWALWTW